MTQVASTQTQTAHGAVAGVQRDGHVAFFGIPYAASTGGEGRFRAPTAPPSWTGVRECFEPGDASPQTTHPIPGFAASGPQSEDCLSLNVFTPALDGERRPVMVWIHGGGFTHGFAAEPLYDGGPLARRGDVVVVSINYRLGALGYLYLLEHLPGRQLTANGGQLDQIAALTWVRDNIAAFGGDPGNVTIFGESAGAAAVGTLLAMPTAKGLFHRAILQSGSGRASTPEQAAKIAGALLSELGLESEPGRILEVPAADIVAAQTAVAAKHAGQLLFGPVIDPGTLPRMPLEAVQDGASAEVPVLLGTNRDEVKLFAASTRREDIDDQRLAELAKASLPRASATEVDDAIATFRSSRAALGLPATNLDILDAIQSEARFRIPSLRLARAQHAVQPETFVYLFAYESPARHGALGSCHALEMPFVFGTLDAPTQDRFAGSGPGVEKLSAAMMDSWLAFASGRPPGHAAIGDWAAYDEARPTMIFNIESGQQLDPLATERTAIEPFV